ncbi:MAG: hypothetical protein ED557_01340 [Balneola sp.]|nr:MAG: hypothetical protein ED557_01340 [Balneola sp.]
MKKVFLPLLFLFFGLTNCINNVEDNTGEEQSGISYAQDVQPIFNDRCVVCHGASGGVNLSTYAALDNSVGNLYGTDVLVPGNAEASGLYDKLLPTPRLGTRMPQGGALSGDEIETIRAWINEGALNN